LRLTIDILPFPESLYGEAAALFVRQAGLAVARRGRFPVALSGGETPRRLDEMLAAPPFCASVAWEKTHVFRGGERCVPAGDRRLNARMAQKALLDRVPVPPDQVHPISCHGNPPAAAREYRDFLHDFFAGGSPVFDLIFLGLGSNDPIAFARCGDIDLAAERVSFVSLALANAFHRRFILEVLHPAQVLPVGIANPSFNHMRIAEVVGVLEIMQGKHQAGADAGPALTWAISKGIDSRESGFGWQRQPVANPPAKKTMGVKKRNDWPGCMCFAIHQ
jgi:Glucosamine-6-phosphate isomerases/6-phosphogluconolactonase